MIKILTKPLSAEPLVVKNSRFIAEVFPVTSQQEAREKLKEQKTKYQDARHVVHAFVIGNTGQILGSSDDGEPSGTAGRPVLDVLKGSLITNILLTVTRYFGGTLLGTGGLVKAYGDSAKKILQELSEKGFTEALIEKKDISFSISYDMYEQLKHLMKSFPLTNIKEEFLTEINISAVIEKESFDKFSDAVKNFSNGKIILK